MLNYSKSAEMLTNAGIYASFKKFHLVTLVAFPCCSVKTNSGLML